MSNAFANLTFLGTPCICNFFRSDIFFFVTGLSHLDNYTSNRQLPYPGEAAGKLRIATEVVIAVKKEDGENFHDD